MVKAETYQVEGSSSLGVKGGVVVGAVRAGPLAMLVLPKVLVVRQPIATSAPLVSAVAARLTICQTVKNVMIIRCIISTTCGTNKCYIIVARNNYECIVVM